MIISLSWVSVGCLATSQWRQEFMAFNQKMAHPFYAGLWTLKQYKKNVVCLLKNSLGRSQLAKIRQTYNKLFLWGLRLLVMLQHWILWGRCISRFHHRDTKRKCLANVTLGDPLFVCLIERKTMTSFKSLISSQTSLGEAAVERGNQTFHYYFVFCYFKKDSLPF